MRLLFALTLASTFALAPLAFAHTDGGPYGTPKTYCEDVKGDQLYHDYGPAATGNFAFSATDGSLAECPYSAGSKTPMFDGHYEFAQGGAILVAADVPQCGWPYADHTLFPTVWVFDHGLSSVGTPVMFWVGSDTLNNLPPDPTQPDCGDFETDFHQGCVDHCTVGFPAGLDGTYSVYVSGTLGHVWTN